MRTPLFCGEACTFQLQLSYSMAARHNNNNKYCRDTVIYSGKCVPLGNKTVAVKVYDKQRLASTKVRAIKREVAMMLYFMRQR